MEAAGSAAVHLVAEVELVAVDRGAVGTAGADWGVKGSEAESQVA